MRASSGRGVRGVFGRGAATISSTVSALSGGAQGLLVDHGEGRETLYANLSEVTVQSGDRVVRGQRLGACENGLYFELRQGGDSVDPTEGLGL